MRVLVLALGNPILCDDGVAFHVIEHLRHLVQESPSLVFDEACTGGLNLLPYITGYDRVLLIDATKTQGGRPGSVHRYSEEEFSGTLHSGSPHSTNFATAMELGHTYHPDEMPKEIAIVAVEADSIDVFGEELTPDVEAAVPQAARAVLEVLRGWGVDVEGDPPK